MSRDQFDELPAAFAELGLPESAIIDKGQVVTYKFKLGFFKRLSVDVIKPDLPNRAYDLWVPLTRSGGALFEGLKQRGYFDVEQWHEAHRKM